MFNGTREEEEEEGEKKNVSLLIFNVIVFDSCWCVVRWLKMSGGYLCVCLNDNLKFNNRNVFESRQCATL